MDSAFYHAQIRFSSTKKTLKRRIITLGTMLDRVSRSFSSAIVVSTALGLFTTTQKMLFESGRITFFPSTRIMSFLGLTLIPGSDVSFPFTTTLPSRICVQEEGTFSSSTHVTTVVFSQAYHQEQLH